jgi:MFS family permease
MRATGDVVETMIPRRLDRLPWSRWHWLVVTGLGITWILDGFEVTIVGAIASILTDKDALGLSTQQSASAGTFYLLGAITGALVFGFLTDRSGRKNLFTITLAVYLVFTVASGLAWNYWSFVGFRFLAGAGIGGEYAAINSAIDELIPARVRGRVALAINGSWWVGTAAGAFFSYALLHSLDESIGWRFGFLIGATLALGIIIIRRFIPESPRWLLTHGRAEEAEEVVSRIEDAVRKEHPVLPEPEGAPIVIEQRERLSFPAIAKYVIQNYPQRGLLGLALMTGQAFLYNAIFFTYTLVLTDFRREREDGAALPDPVRGRELPRPAPARALVRRDRAPRDDPLDVHHLRAAPDCDGRALRPRRAHPDDDDDRVVRDFLLRLSRGQLRLPVGQRALSAGGARDGDRALLCGRDGVGSALTDAVRRPDREREPHER